MKNVARFTVVSAIVTFSLSGCSAADVAAVNPAQDASVETFEVQETFAGLEGSVALALENPIDYLDPQYSDYVVGVIEGTIIDVNYTVINTVEGQEDTFTLSTTHSVMTVDVTRSSNPQISGTITAVTNGAYIPVDADQAGGALVNPSSGDAVNMYPTAGGGLPPVAGEKVVLVLTTAEGVMAPLAKYLVVGSSIGRFVLDTGGEYVRVDRESPTRLKLSDEFLAKAFS